MKPSLLIIITLFIGFNHPLLSQVDLKWAHKISGTDQVEQANAIVVDGAGNVYVAGEFNRTTDFDPSAGTAILTGIGTGSLYLAKYDSLGNYKWVIQLGDNGVALDLKLDVHGDLILSGRFSGTVDFDPGPSVSNLTISNTADGGFFAKYDTAGNYIWAKNIYSDWSTGSDPTRIATDTAGNIYITGTFTATKDFDPGIGVANLTANTYNYLASETFFAKYTTNGDYVWAKTIEGQATGVSISADKYGNVFLTGSYYGTVDFDPNAGISNLSSVPGSQSYYGDAYFAKYDINGNYLWAKSIGGATMDGGLDIVNDTVGNVYITGFFTGVADFNPDSVAVNNLSSWSNSTYNAYYAKYDNNGQYLWAQSYLSNNSSRGAKIAFDKNGDLYIIGTVYAGAARYQVLLTKYTADGTSIWATGFGSIYDEFGKCLAIDTIGNIHLSGEFAGTVNFGVYSVVNLTSDGTYGTGVPDAFFAKYKQLPPNYAGVISGTSSICAGQTNVVFSVPVIYGATSYNWVLPNGATIVSGNNSQTITVNFSANATSGIITVNGYNIAGAGYPSSFPITIHPLPIINVSYSDTTLCSNTSSILSASGATTYTWLPVTGLSNASIANPLASPLLTTTYTVTGTTNGCANTNTVHISIPALTISGTSIICNGSNTSLMATGIDSVEWINGPTSQQYIVAPTTTTTYYAIGTSPEGCKDTAMQTVNVLPVYHDTVISETCTGTTYLFGTQNITSSGNYAQQLVSVNGCDSIIYLNITFNPVFTIANPQWICDGNTYSINGNSYISTGNYYDTLATSHGCDSIILTQLTVTTIDTSVAVMGATIISNAIAMDYQWMDCTTGNTIITNAINQSYTPSANGAYSVMITVNGCVDTSACVNIMTVGNIEATTDNEEWWIQPNPSNGVFHISAKHPLSANIIIFNVIGETVYQSLITAKESTIDLTNVKKGIYFVKLMPENKREVYKKLVIE
ncbi:MAG: T9SS type A sorting domain-containing protein [Bacteroidota bacterium]